MKFTLGATQDISGLGVELEWMTPNDMLVESLEMYPGIAATALGFIAVGTCLLGSGDPYFVRATSDDDPPLMRIPHDRLGPDLALSESAIETVRPHLSDFFRIAKYS
jgi:hypothetical protein